MPRQLSPTEELDYTERLIYPNFVLRADTITEKSRLADEISRRTPQQLLFLGGIALSEPAVVAGLAPEYVEHLIRSGSLPQKAGFLGIIESDERKKELRDIARKLDFDIGEKSRAHQERIEGIIAYLTDVAPAIRDDRGAVA